MHDVGTGSGCIAIALKAARPELAVSVSDVDAACLEVCRVNQRRLLGRECLHARVADLLAGVPGPLDMIVANPPYLDTADLRADGRAGMAGARDGGVARAASMAPR